MMDSEKKQIENKAFTEECNAVLMAVSDALYAIGGKWKLMIIISMARGNKRFTEIQRQVKGISARVLSSELKELEINGFIIKKVAVGYPERLNTNYYLIVKRYKKWGMQHRQKIKTESSLDKSKN